VKGSFRTKERVELVVGEAQLLARDRHVENSSGES